MKNIILAIGCLFVFAGMCNAQTPSPAPVPSPSPELRKDIPSNGGTDKARQSPPEESKAGDKDKTK